MSYIYEFFDWNFYVNKYNLNKQYYNNQYIVYDYLILNGLYKTNIYTNIDSLLDINYYRNSNNDIQHLNNNDIIYHFVNNGLYENRKAIEFNETNLNLNISKFCNQKIYNYITHSDLLYYIKKYSSNNFIEFNNRHGKTNFYDVFNKKNYFDIDLKFYKFGHNINHCNSQIDLLNHLEENAFTKGLIYCPKQLLNLFDDIDICTNISNDIYVYNREYKYCKLDTFINDNIYSKSFDELINLVINKIYFNLSYFSNILVCAFIGNLENGTTLINRLINYKNIEKFNLSICFNSINIYNSLKNVIETNFPHYAIYICKELGNDITPTLFMYNDIRKSHEFFHIIKLHTKSNIAQFSQLTDFLLDKRISDLMPLKKKNCNVIGYHTMYIRDDIFNSDLNKLYHNHIRANYQFVVATIFYTNIHVFDAMLNFIKINNYRSYFVSNMYDNGCINYKKSVPHFLERLFGVIKL